MTVPRATYRLQFNSTFGFDAAAAIAPYLARLGISHVYASPYLKARPGSTHGYDIVDHDALNPELGDDAAFQRMNKAFADNRLGQILDFVPNHMGVGGSDNPLWLDVLEWGADSAHAGWFDIDWDPDRRYLHGKVLIPFLGDQYGAVLESGQLRLKFDRADGSFAVWAYDTHKLPICPLHYNRILGADHPELERIGDFFAGLPDWRPQIPLRAAELKAELAALCQENEEAATAIQSALDRFNGTEGDLASWLGLDALIQDQHWRVAHFRVASDDINYRRFFDINDLAGLRMELPAVFDHAHRLVFRLLRDGTIDGIRIDHIDGLLDPKAYLQRLRDAGGAEFYLIVEKILAHHETLREDWPVNGTTGYEFCNALLGLLIDPASEESFTISYVAFTGRSEAFADIVRDCKARIMTNEMASELNVLARDAGRVARENPRTADFTKNILLRAIRAVVACFPVYRTYIDTAGQPTQADRRDLDWAVSQARRLDPDLDPSVFDFLYRLLSGDLVAQPRSGFSRYSVFRCAMKAQQYSGPVMAKGLEDTAFYRYNRFIALNEVGGNPPQFGVSQAAFHRANRLRAQNLPYAMLSTSTHDTKRGEDTRARLAVLSELPDEWSQKVQIWSRLLRARRGDIEGAGGPDRNDEYAFFQMLLGTWPPDLLDQQDLGPETLAPYRDRIKATLVKSMREAKQHSTWAAPDERYEAAMLDLADLALDPTRSGTFLNDFLPFAANLAQLGSVNTLIQTVLKLTLPGVPDIYRGTELWDLTLVDPDNRRPVDYSMRSALLRDLDLTLVRDRLSAMRDLMQSWQDARFKMAATATLLRLRAVQPDLFATGDYDPITTPDEVFAFVRRHGTQTMLVSVHRFPARRAAHGTPDVRLELPEELADSTWQDVLTGQTFRANLDLPRLHEVLPCCVLLRTE